MRVLALETSGRTGSVALLTAGPVPTVLVEERVLPPGVRTARSLLPVVDALLRDHAWSPADLELVCTTTGPGSFTGLRIGVVAAKMLAYATGAKLVGVHTLAAIAAGTRHNAAPLWAVLDAQRQQLFAEHFAAERNLVEQATSPRTEVLSVDDWLARLRPGDAIAGPPLEKLALRAPPHARLLAEDRWAPSARSTGELGIELFNAGLSIAPMDLLPHYYRNSAAEEKAARGEI